MGPKPNIELVIVAREWNMLINWAWSQRKMKELLLGKGNGMLAGQKKKKKRGGHKSHGGCRSEADVHPFIHLADASSATHVCHTLWEALRLSNPSRYSTYSYEAWVQWER